MNETAVLRATVGDDHRLLAQSIALAARLGGIDCTVAELTDAASVLAQVTADRPDVVLLDLDLGPQVGDGAALVGPMSAAGIRVLVMSGSTDPVRLGSTLEAGAVGVLAKTEPVEVLLAAARSAAAGRPVMAPDERQRLLRAAGESASRSRAALAPFTRLTEREAHVLRALALGHGVAAIAAHGHVAEATVRTQVRGVLTKLGVGSQLEAVALAHRSGWADLSPCAW